MHASPQPASHGQLAAPVFRADINGLRALAVIAVTLFHFGVPGFEGGFIGVDVFFVISGYLMTQIICTGLDRRNFSLFGFYLARASRIVPALLALCACLLVIGWAVLLPSDYKMLASHAVYSLLFVSNIEYWLEAGYFDAASDEKWLLHTWSLSVEWQFYLLLPVLLAGLAKLAPGAAARARTIAVLFALSLGWCIWATASDATAAFFLLPTRAWEMLAGGLLYLLGAPAWLTPAVRRRCELAGLAAILGSVILFDHRSAWPGSGALLPAAGALLVLLAGRKSVWTGNPIAQWAGTRSYSIYLWHWPVYVTLAYMGLADDAAARVAGLSATCLLGALSFHLIENPARHALRGRTPAIGALGLGASMLLVMAAGLGVWRMQGIDGRFAPEVERAAAESENIHPARQRCHQLDGTRSPACIFGGTEPKILLVGDSHAVSVVSSLVDASPGPEAGVVQLSYSACMFVPGMKKVRDKTTRAGANCEAYNRWVAQRIAAAPPDIPVVLVGHYAALAFDGPGGELGSGVPKVYFSAPVPVTTPAFLAEFGRQVTASACALARTRRVYMVRPIPEMPEDAPKHIARQMAWGRDPSLSMSMERYMQRNEWIWRAQNAARDGCGITIIDPTEVLCKDGGCEASENGRPRYYDSHHLSEFGNRRLVPLFAPIYR